MEFGETSDPTGARGHQASRTRSGILPGFVDRRRPVGKVEELLVGGYKSIRDMTTLRIRPVTILAGHNTSGKSSLLQPFLLLKQTLEQEASFGPLSLEGAHVHFNRFRQLFWNGKPKSADSIRIGYGCRIDPDLRRCTESIKVVANELVVSEVSMSVGNRKATLRSDVLHAIGTASGRTFGRQDGSIESVLWPDEMARIEEFLGQPLVKDHTPENPVWLWFAGRRPFADFRLAYETPSGVRPFFSVAFSPFDALEKWVEQLIHVPGDRGTDSRYHRWSPAGAHASSGVFQERYASILWDWDRSKSDVLDVLDGWMERIGLGSRVRTHQVNDVDMEVLVSRNPRSSGGAVSDDDMVSIADTGLGVSYALPWLVALAAADRQPVYIEEPEAHLHPEAQYVAAEIIADAARRGTTVIVETHSDILVLGLQRLVAKGALAAEDVGLYWFDRDQDGATHIAESRITQYGELPLWKGDLDLVFEDAKRDFLKASLDREKSDRELHEST